MRWSLGLQQGLLFTGKLTEQLKTASPLLVLSHPWFPVSYSFYPMRTQYWLFSWYREYILWLLEGIFTTLVVSENIRVIKWTESVFFEVVGGQSQGFVVGSWLLFTLVESESVKDLFVYGRNEILVLSEEPSSLHSTRHYCRVPIPGLFWSSGMLCGKVDEFRGESCLRIFSLWLRVKRMYIYFCVVSLLLLIIT